MNIINKRTGLLFLLATTQFAPQKLHGQGCFNPSGHLEMKAVGKSFLSVRPPFQLNSPEFLAGWWYDRMDARGKECRNGTVQLVGFGGKSTESCDLATYFTFNYSPVLVINEQAGLPDTDILSEQVNIYTVNGTFKSFLALNPKYSFGGLGISYRQEFATNGDNRSFWFLISSPVTVVSTGMNLKETIINDGGGVNPDATGAVPNAIQAFSQSSYKYGKILRKNKSKASLGDITALIGYKTVFTEDYDMDGYAGLIAPTGNKVKSKELFEPMVGANHHGGFILGSSASVTLWECHQGARIDFEFSAHGQYLLQGREIRSFDLKNKPWSRYMQMYANQTDAQAAANEASIYAYTTPGINILTQQVNVYPGFSSISNTAAVFTTCDGSKQLEIGYNFYARQSEFVELACPWQMGPALKALDAPGGTNSVQIIGNNYNSLNNVAVGDYNENLIKVSDLDMLSATQPAIISNTLYANAAYRSNDREYPLFVTGGGSYEFEEDNTTLNRWTLWLKAGVSF